MGRKKFHRAPETLRDADASRCLRFGCVSAGEPRRGTKGRKRVATEKDDMGNVEGDKEPMVRDAVRSREPVGLGRRTDRDASSELLAKRWKRKSGGDGG